MKLITCLLSTRLFPVSSVLARTLMMMVMSTPPEKKLEPILVSVEGNIGAGKTTLLDFLRKGHPEWIFIREPVDTWSSIRNDHGESLLQVFYKDRKRWSYTFQNCALLTRHQNIESAINDARASGLVGKQIFLTERCLQTDYQVFTKMLKAEGSIDELELNLYKRWLGHLLSTATPLQAIVHVTTNPEVCAQRIKSRARQGEDAIPLEYLQSLEVYQTKWLDSIAIPSIPTDLRDNKCNEEIEAFIEGLIK